MKVYFLHFLFTLLVNHKFAKTVEVVNPIQTIYSIQEFPQPFSGSTCNLFEFNNYLSKQISSQLKIEAQNCFNLDTKVSLDIEINKAGNITVLTQNLDFIKMTIPNFETPALINSQPVKLKYQIPIYICHK